MKPLVSILIPAHNAQAWLAETLRSALAQTWPRKEIIVVDDGSSDQTMAVAQGFSSQGVTVVNQRNQGAAAARNHAFDLSRGDFIQWLDADDLLAPDKIARQMDALERCRGSRTLLSGAWGSFFFRTGKARFQPSPLWRDQLPVDWLIAKMSLGNHMQTATWLVSRELTEASGPWNTKLLGDDDGEYFCRVILACDGIVFVPESIVYYRSVGSNRLSYTGRSHRRLEAAYLSIQLHIGYLRSLEDSERTRTACVKYLQKYMFDLHPDRPDLVDQMRRLAVELGGQLQYPRSKWKYIWIERLFGWNVAKSAALRLPLVKANAISAWDRLMFMYDSRKR